MRNENNPAHFNQKYDTIKSEFENKPFPSLISLIGNPRFGKTYTAIRLLYDFFIQGNNEIAYIQNIYELGNLLSKVKYQKKDIYIYIEDPFGADDYDSHYVQKFFEFIKIHHLRVVTRDGFIELITEFSLPCKVAHKYRNKP